MTTATLRGSLSFLPDLIKTLNKIMDRVRSVGETIYLVLTSLPARPIILSVIGALCLFNLVRAALPFVVIQFGASSVLSGLNNILLALDNLSVVILIAALYFTKFGSTSSELKADLTWFTFGIVAKQFAWHLSSIVSASLMNFGGSWVNWCWIWGVVYALALVVIVKKGGAYVSINSNFAIVPGKANKK